MAVIECPDPLDCPKVYGDYSTSDYTIFLKSFILGYVVLRIIK